MRPTINLHGIASIRLTSIETLADINERHYFRDLVLTDINGDTVTVTMFSRDPDGLEIDAGEAIVKLPVDHAAVSEEAGF